MKRLIVACALALAAGLCAACVDVFQDIGTDPHPPTAQLLGIAYQPPEPEEGLPPEPAVLLPAEGFVIRPTDGSANTILLRVQFADAGGDVEHFRLRDRDSSLDEELVPVAAELDLDGDGEPETLPTPEFFTGAAGIVDLEGVEVTSTLLGTHRMEFWAEDSHGSRSEKVSFTVELLP